LIGIQNSIAFSPLARLPPMTDLTLVSLDFHACHGPAVRSIDGPLTFSDPVRRSLEASAFPESAIPLRSSSHVYSFVVSTFYCHCIYIRKTSTRAVRGFRQFAFVFITELGFLEPVFDLLRSVRSILARRYSDILALMASMFKTWSKILAEASEQICDFPLFDGPAMYASAPASRLQLLGSVECEADLPRVWAHLVLGRPVVVFGSTPEIASRAVLELVWLVHEFSVVTMIPYICVSDPRFPELAREPVGVVGVSNPIAPSLFAPNAVLVRVGFPGRTFRWPFIGAGNSREEFDRLRRNTEALASAIGETVDAGEGTGTKIIAAKLAEKGVATSTGLGDFAARLITSPGYLEFVEKRSQIRAENSKDWCAMNMVE
jgi:hypothetical protein